MTTVTAMQDNAAVDIFADDYALSPEDQAACDARQASGYWDAIESGRFEVRSARHPQQQGMDATGDYASKADAEAAADELRAKGHLFYVCTAPIHVYRGTGERVGG